MSSMTVSLPSLLPPGHVHLIVVCCVLFGMNVLCVVRGVEVCGRSEVGGWGGVDVGGGSMSVLL